MSPDLSLRDLCVLRASAVKGAAIFSALLSFGLWPFSVKELLATYIVIFEINHDNLKKSFPGMQTMSYYEKNAHTHMGAQTYSPLADETSVLSDHAAGQGAIHIDPAFPMAPTKEFHEPFLKRLLDILISSTMLLASIPLSALIAIAIKLEDRGPIFYRQQRWGRFGKKFMVFKFRTMIPDADKKFGLRQAKENDPRVTRVGRILRAAGLDELPQIINILLGEMSFVGPRALAVGEIIFDNNGQRIDYEKTAGFHRRQAARPGLTSLATIYIPKDSPTHRKFRYDLLYVRKISLGLDLRLIALSFWISFRGKWETRQRKV
jgi:lipopolysaccharide/colanic/teichoic acid biosynthesis glycosyltransferase